MSNIFMQNDEKNLEVQFLISQILNLNFKKGSKFSDKAQKILGSQKENIQTEVPCSFQRDNTVFDQLAIVYSEVDFIFEQLGGFEFKFKLGGSPNHNLMSIISVEGNLGAGKSTLLGMLNADTIKEPVDEWENTAGNNILQRYYSDPKRWAFTFQLNALHSRSKLWEEAIKNSGDNKKVLFSERSPLADRYIFGEIMQREGNFEEVEYAVYDSLCRSIIGNLPVKGIIYLRCSPDLCLERIKKRNRKGEEGIALEYIKKVHERHESWISRQKEDCEVLVIDTEYFDVEKTEDQEQVMKLITAFVEKIQNKNS